MPRSTPSVLLLTVALAISSAPASAQHLRAWGLKGAATLSSIQTELPSEDPEQRRGYSAFVFGEWAAAGPLSLVAEAGYLERGYSRDASVAVDDRVFEHRLDKRFQYVSVAALARVTAGTLGPVSPYVVAGPRMNALVGNRRGEGVPNYDYRPVVWDASIGAGMEARHAVLEVRYNVGLNDALQGEWGEPAYHRAVDFVLGWKF
ncbi:MAG TPA: porin family protein [Longimicrobium sp.]|nr:porin family protein [Longimicrobium sp.]